jgi:fructoselysine-6-P-deglycase FrlB-like protein
VSQSGQSREVVESLRQGPTGARLGITAQPSATIGASVETVIDISVPEDSAVRVVGYTASVQALILLAEALAGTSPAASSWDTSADQWEGWAEAADGAVNDFLGDDPGPASIDFVATGADAGTAAQGALLAREAGRLHASSYDTYQYLHGPVEAVRPGAMLVTIGSGREVALAQSLALAGAKVLLVTEAPVKPEGTMTVLNIQARQRPLSWLPAVLAVQVLAWEVAQRAGLAVEGFQHHQDDTKV